MKKILSILLAVSLTFSSLPFFNQTEALETYRTVTKYHLDMGVIHIWSSDNGATWQNGLVYGTTPSDPFTASLTFSYKITKVVDAYVLDEDEFDWTDTTGIYTFNEVENYLTSKDTYEKNYKPYMSNAISSVKATKNGDYTVDLSYKAKLKGLDRSYNLSDMLNRDKFDDIIALLGGEGSVKQDLYDKLEAGKDGVGEGVLGYMFFVPIVIEYQTIEKVTIEEDEFYAGLDVPSSALVGESFDVIDESVFGDESQFACTTLTYCVDDGTTKTVTGWTGAELRDSISQSFDKECTVKYTIKAWNIYGKDSDPVSKTIKISSEEATEIDVEPDLVLPEYTYEGHTEIAVDESVFTVNGENYSAARTYAEGLASNSFKADDSSIRIDRLSDTKAECTFPKKGTHDITLTVKPDSGGRSSDIESIEVRKTPYIVDSLSGFQKQNRKQILTATVATYPGKPLTDYSVTLKDKKTGGSVTLTPDNLQENNTTIKTRSMTINQDVEEGFAYITVEFLTKTPSYFSTGTNTQDFYYQIDVTDSKGDSDCASKSFAVSPDIPPAAAVSMDTAFLRNEGTNVATIKAEDGTVAKDGDSVERTWYYGATTAPAVFADVSTMDGYKKLSFGTDKIVGFNRTGVGPLTVKLLVKEKWTEPTLEEYVTDAEHLTGSVLAYTEVQNVAPVVSLELLNGTEQEILLLANNAAEYQALLNKKTALQQELLANKIDGQIIIKKLLGNSPAGLTGIQQQRTYLFPISIFDSGLIDEAEVYLLAADSEMTYLLTYNSWENLKPIVPKTIHAYSPYNGEVWSYTTSRDEPFTFGQDDTDQYLYLIYNSTNQTVVLDKNTGTVAGTINMALSEKVWLAESLAYIVKDGSLYAIDFNTMASTLIEKNVSAVSRVGGKLQYVTKSGHAIVRGIVDMETMVSTESVILKTTSTDDYVPVCIDSEGTLVLWKSKGTGTDQFQGIMAIKSDNETASKVAFSPAYSDNAMQYVKYALDEKGVCNYVMIVEDGYRSVLKGINIRTGTTASCQGAGDTFSGAFESGGIAYFLYSGWYYSGGVGYNGNAYYFKVSGASGSLSPFGPAALGQHEERIAVSDRIIASYFGDNPNKTLTFKIAGIPKTLAQETAEIVSRFTDKLTFLGGADTTADEIIAKAKSEAPAIKITASQSGSLTLYNQSLDENKKYYYDYEIKPLQDGTAGSLTGLKAATATVMSGQPFLSDTYYVQKTYFEDFQDSNTNSFFTIGSGIWSQYGAFGAFYSSKYLNTNDAPITFTVPAGCVAVLSFDYDIYYLSTNHLESAVYIDGERFYTDAAPDANVTGETYSNKVWIPYTHFKLLYPGIHTLTCHRNTRNNTASTFIDNLKVEVLTPAKPTLAASYNSQTDKNGWMRAEGAFETPNGNISYGSQGSSYYSGGLPGGVTDYFSPKKYGTQYPSRGEYYQTVPSGYLQKGWCYPYGSCAYDDTIEFNIAGYPYKIGEEGTISSGDKIFLRTMPEGTYTHTYKNNSKGNASWINQWDLITYPSNSQTLSGNISFDSTFTKYYFPKESSAKLTNLSIALPKGEYLLKNLKIYYMDNGRKVYLVNEDCQELSDLSKWTLSSGLTTASYTESAADKEDDEYVKVYKKGEKVLYNIFYSDYESDPSKAGYWVYSHINWPPDTIHPEAGKTLTVPIDRFYLSGKYTVTHWEVDNTQQTGTAGDATPYNKESNKVTMTFYVDGEGKAPWVTYIKTNPSDVKENDGYTIRIGVDDEEKDALALTTEVYLNGKLIKTDNKTGLTTDANGNYPEQIITGLQKAVAGVYQVVCTVSDYSGTGIKSYKYTVVSEGKITGYVNHTDQWNINRQKYNLAKSGTTDSPRAYDVFWSGEEFVLRSDVAGSPTSVTAQILGYSYRATMHSTGAKNSSGETVYSGEIWDEDMINKWGNDGPVTLTFSFTAYYSGGTAKTHDVNVIVDNEDRYFKLHRYF